MKIDIPKNTWISEVQFDFFKEGFWARVLGLTLNLTGNNCPGIEFLSEVLEPLSKLELPRRKIIRLQGFFNPNDQFLEVVVRAFKSWGFMVQAVVASEQLGAWTQELDWLIYKTDKPFVPIAANELWYCPPAQEELPEPRLPPKDMLLYVNRGYSVAATTRFIVRSERNWNLL